jgi:ATP/maltotriose-dependent transcriptional regulator MalT
MQNLLRTIASKPAGTLMLEYLHRLLAEFEREGFAPLKPLENQPISANTAANQKRVEPLNEREIEILSLMAQGLSNSAIAERLMLSTKTIKWHAYNLYGKLGVNSRTQAIAAAREQLII